MSLLQRISAVHPRRYRTHGSANVAHAEPAADPISRRYDFPKGPFAGLTTNPPEAADAAYAAFMRHELTPGVAEREVATALADAEVSCPALETMTNYAFELERERTPAARRRLFVRYLVGQQYIHESNMRTLHALRRAHTARRVMILPGCCPVCDALANRPHRFSHPPELPTPGCQRHGGCICGYVPVIE
jgi:hypothetical protein